jgi:hypothetical protein
MIKGPFCKQPGLGHDLGLGHDQVKRDAMGLWVMEVRMNCDHLSRTTQCR